MTTKLLNETMPKDKEFLLFLEEIQKKNQLPQLLKKSWIIVEDKAITRMIKKEGFYDTFGINDYLSLTKILKDEKMLFLFISLANSWYFLTEMDINGEEIINNEGVFMNPEVIILIRAE